MRALLRTNFSSEHEIARMKEHGILPNGVLVRTDSETGRRYFNYTYRLSTDMDWDKIGPYVESLSNLVRNYCDLVEEGIYHYDGKNSKLAGRVSVIVILKRNDASGVTWEEVEIYGTGVPPEDISEAHRAFVNKEFTLAAKWSSGIPYHDYR